ncbi:S1C family serine protease [Alteromonas sp. BZK5]|uniref:S1C family serine protease n=1 Tax=Alteromonas sp. BZK5 TaxID=1904459 RepID=UPI00165372D7|nr:serine protease [Alteromonas sp. BZK5]MBC6987701.1 trypsin-like peptidase domain-containing protein [Alteromonas sp. BZK5]
MSTRQTTLLGILFFFHLLLLNFVSAQDAITIYKDYKNNIAEIVVKNDLDGEVMRGTAIYATDNMFMTNAHVVKGGSEAIVLIGDEKYNVVSAELSRSQDFALVIIDTNGKDLPLKSFKISFDVEVGQDVYVISNPVGFNQSITDGIISSIRGNIIQHTAAVSPGSSGGALFSKSGDLIGIITSRHRDETSMGFGLSIEAISRELNNEAGFFSLFEEAPLLGGKAIIGMSHADDGLTVQIDLFDPVSLVKEENYLRYKGGARVISYKNNAVSRFAEIEFESLFDCKNKTDRSLYSRLYGPDKSEVIFETGESDEWHPVKDKFKATLNAYCEATVVNNQLYYSLRELHSYITTVMPIELLRKKETVNAQGGANRLLQYILKHSN